MEAADIDPIILIIIAIAVNFILYFLLADRSSLKESSPQAQKSCVEPYYKFCSKDVLDYSLNKGKKRKVVSLSVIVVAYNNESSLPLMLDECFDYLENRYKSDRSFTYEVIIVDNYSRDSTKQVAKSYSDVYGLYKCAVISIDQHRNVEYAAFLGMLHARGKLVLCTDADSSTKFSNVTKLEERLASLVTSNRKSFVIGVDPRNRVGRSFIGAFTEENLTVLPVPRKCGFTLFTFEAAEALLSDIKDNSSDFEANLLNSVSRNNGIHKTVLLD